jgi:hypothetical protein
MWTVPIKNPNADGVKVIVKKKALVGYDFVRLKGKRGKVRGSPSSRARHTLTVALPSNIAMRGLCCA